MKRPQFGIRTIFLVTFIVCLIAGIFSQNGTVTQRILVAVLFSNFLGAVLALVVTFVLKFPRDGSHRHGLDDGPEDQHNASGQAASESEHVNDQVE